MNRAQLLTRLGGTEWADFEVKSAAGGVSRDAFKTIAAFANSGGGWLVFGVSETDGGYALTGIEDIDRFQNDLLSAIRTGDTLRPQPATEARVLRVADRWVLTLRVEESKRTDKPVRAKVSGRWQAYVRIGAGDHRCRPEEEGRFVRDATEERYDQAALPYVQVSDLDPKAVGWLRGLIDNRHPAEADPAASAEEWLESKALIRTDGQLTRAAGLFFGTPRVIAGCLPRGIVDLRVMHTPVRNGIPDHRWDDRRFCDGNLVEAIKSLLERMHSLCPQPFEMEETGPHRRSHSREEEALREALINLISHQDYSDQSRIPTVLWWRDEIRFRNTGDSLVATELLPGGGHSLPRNPLIARLLRQAELAEQAGTGMPKILKIWREAGRPAPTIHNIPGDKLFEMVFPWGEPLDEPLDEPLNEPLNEPVSRGADLSKRAAGLLDLIATNPGLRSPELIRRTGTSRATVRRALQELEAAGFITFRGAPKTGGYYLTTEGEEEPDP